MANYHKYATPATLASDIVLSRKKFSYVIVEGETDFLFLKRVIDNKNCKVTPVGGKSKVIEVLNILQKRNKCSGVVGVVDKDFMILEEKIDMENVVFMDVHDLECLILQSDALEKLLEKWADEKKLATLERSKRLKIREIMLMHCAPISVLKFLSNKYGLDMDFKLIDKQYDRIIQINGNSITFNIDELFRIAKLTTEKVINARDLKKEIIDLTKTDADLWMICCGHQLVRVLTLILEKTIGVSKHIDPLTIESDLYLSYEIIHFVQSKVYEELSKWEHENETFRIFCKEMHGIADSLKDVSPKFRIVVDGVVPASKFCLFPEKVSVEA